MPDVIPYRDAAAALNMTKGSVRVAVYRLKQRYGELVRQEITQTIATAEQVDEEMNALNAALIG